MIDYIAEFIKNPTYTQIAIYFAIQTFLVWLSFKVKNYFIAHLLIILSFATHITITNYLNDFLLSENRTNGDAAMLLINKFGEIKGLLIATASALFGIVICLLLPIRPILGDLEENPEKPKYLRILFIVVNGLVAVFFTFTSLIIFSLLLFQVFLQKQVLITIGIAILGTLIFVVLSKKALTLKNNTQSNNTSIMKASLTPQKTLILGLLAIVGVLLVGYIIYLYIVPFIVANITYILGLGAIIALIAFAKKQPKLFKKHQKNLLLIGGIALVAYFSYRAISYLALLPQETAVSLLALGFTGTIVLGVSAIALTLLTIITVILLTFLNKFYLNQLHKQQDIKETYKASNLAFIFSVISAIITGIKKNFRWSLLISILLIFVINIAWITDQISSMLQLNNLVTWSQQKIKKNYTLDDVIPPLLLDISREELPFVINQPTINAQQAREIAYFFYKYVTNDKNYGTLIDDIKKEYPYPVNKLKPPYNAVGIFFGSTNVIFGINLDPVLTDKDIDNQSKIRFLKESRNQINLASYLLAKGFTSRQIVEINTESSAKAQNTKISPTQQRIEESAMETVLDQINRKASRSSIQQELEAFREQNAPPIYKMLGNHAITIAVVFDTTQILLNIITIVSILILIGLFTYHVIIPITIAYGLPNLKQIYATLTDTRNPSTAEASVIKTALTQIEFKENAPKYDGIRVIALSSQNAYAVGKTIVLHKGLLTLKPEEIAAVIAHEIAHIELKHTRITALMPPIPVIRRKFEYEADAWVTTKTNQGLELANFLRFHDFLDLEDNAGDEPYKDIPIIGGRTHPENEMRRDRILRILGIDNQDQSFTYPDIEPQSVSDMAVANPRIAPRPSKAGI